MIKKPLIITVIAIDMRLRYVGSKHIHSIRKRCSKSQSSDKSKINIIISVDRNTSNDTILNFLILTARVIDKKRSEIFIRQSAVISISIKSVSFAHTFDNHQFLARLHL